MNGGTVTVKPVVEMTQVGSIAASGAFSFRQTASVGSETNTVKPIWCATQPPEATVESTVEFIQKNYDPLFRKLAE